LAKLFYGCVNFNYYYRVQATIKKFRVISIRKIQTILKQDITHNRSVGNRQAAAIYEKYAPALLSVCLRYCGNIQDAEDVLHEGFIKILRSIDSFRDRGNGSFEAWMRRIMVNTALNFLRDHARERRFVDIDPITDIIDTTDEEDENLLQELAERIEPKVVMDMICELPQGYRSVFNMYVFESFSHREIAQALNCSENTSKSQLSKARALLRKKLNGLLIMKTESHEKE
jgi:RNA polymerase sigma-70 factor, ECF subfamily